MARVTDQFRQSDVTLWGIVALVAGGVALFSANVSALVPDSLLAGLHGSRLIDRNAVEIRTQLDGLAGAKAQLAALAASEQKLQAANDQLSSHFSGLVEGAAAVRERVSALEGALPRLVKTLPIDPEVDPTLITGSIGTAPPGFSVPVSYPAESGAKPAPLAVVPAPVVAVPAPAAAATPTSDQPMPSDLVAATAAADAAEDDAGPQGTTVTPAVAAPSALPVTPLAAVLPKTDVSTEVSAASAAASAPAAKGSAGDTAVAATPVPLAPVLVASVPTASLATPSGSIATAQPAASPADVKAIGVAIGSPVQPAGALAAWQALAARVGVLLVGTSPLLADDPAGSPGKVLVAGPIGSIESATKLCADIGRADVPCTPMPYVGMELTAAPAAAQ